ncbi:MAG: hypothetical protein LUF35_13970 [Lachnospiraceae bacterium]|nr:hypothetical protein [Lachnospiraceae bacterium]
MGWQRVGQRRKEKQEEIARLVDRLGTEDAEALLRICQAVEELEKNG